MNTGEIHKKEVKLKIKMDLIKIKFKNSVLSFFNLHKGMSFIIYKLIVTIILSGEDFSAKMRFFPPIFNS